MTYDLLVKGGHVLDPGQGLDGRLDIAISGGKISRMTYFLDTERLFPLFGLPPRLDA